MNTQRSIDDIMNEMNNLAKVQGRYLGKAFWEIPPQSGSILDVAETPESSARIARLRARRRAREQCTVNNCETVAPLQPEVSEPVQGQLSEEAAKGHE